MKKKMIFILVIYCLSFLTLASCREEEISSEEELVLMDYEAKAVATLKTGSTGKPSDWEIIVTPPKAAELITEYRLFYEESITKVNVSNSELASMKTLSSTSYTSINSADLASTLNLNPNQLSMSSTTINTNKIYELYVLSIGVFNNQEVLAISSIQLPSFVNELNIEDFTVTEIRAEDVRNEGKPSDITVSFSGAESQEDVQEYLLVGVKSNSTLTVDQVMAMDSDRVTKIKNENEKYEVTLRDDFLDADGEAFKIENEYQFYVMTVGSFDGENVFALSNATPPVQLIQNPETKTLVNNFRGNGSMEIDPEGNIYVNEFGEGAGNAGLGTSAFKITPNGDVEEFVSDLSGPVGNTLDSDGNYYVNNGNEGNEGDFLKIAPDGTQTVLATIDGYPTDILTGIDGNFYIANWTKPSIHKVTPEGTLTDFVSDQRLAGCTGITYDDNQNIIVGNFSSGRIMSIDNDGVISEIATIPTVVSGFVIGYIDYFEGHVYATGYGSNKIYKVSLSGEVKEFAGTGERASIDGELDKASFVTPNGIAIDESRRILYVSQNFLGEPTSLRVIPLD